MLYIFSGLPGTGKSTLSAALAREFRVTYLRVDVVEQAMRVAGTWVDGPEGYIVCYDIASQNLRLGLDVIADTVNPIHETRQAWREVADSKFRFWKSKWSAQTKVNTDIESLRV